MDVFRKLRSLISRGASVEAQNRELEKATVKRLIQTYARASFTQSGPGVKDALRRVIMDRMTPRQALIAMRCGWEKGALTDKDFRALMRRK